jgi:hypothetical protein
MRYRKLDENGDMIFGHGTSDYYVDNWQLVLQAIVTRLRLWKGEWYLSLEDGTPWEQEILGKTTKFLRDSALQEIILNTYGVTELLYFYSWFDREKRFFLVTFKAQTIYGIVEGDEVYAGNRIY